MKKVLVAMLCLLVATGSPILVAELTRSDEGELAGCAAIINTESIVTQLNQEAIDEITEVSESTEIDLTFRNEVPVVYSDKEYSYIIEALSEYCNIIENTNVVFVVDENPSFSEDDNIMEIKVNVNNGDVLTVIIDRTYDVWTWEIRLPENDN